ncbi:MAG: SDR family NAD(P)-dependent oxidoreductase [Marmoricola sp.]
MNADTLPPAAPGAVLAALESAVEAVLDRTVLLGYSRLGHRLRRRWWPAGDPAPDALGGRTAVVTGATSGLGLATARALGTLGADVRLVVRDEQRGRQVAARLAAEAPAGSYAVTRCDLADLDDVRRAAAQLRAEMPRIDVLVHNAGAMPPRWTPTPQGHETTLAVHVLGPVLLTELLLPALAHHAGDGARVVLVASGGMYTQRLRPEDLEYRAEPYRKAVAYARSKRLQVALVPVLQERWAAAGVAVHAMHPGWADTPGVADAMPVFRALAGPLLRTPDAGADTIVWLAATEPAPGGGLFWQDRRPRPTHYRRATRETAAEREEAWRWVCAELSLDKEGAR